MMHGVNCTGVGGEPVTTLAARAWSRRASDQRMGVHNGRTLRWPSVEHEARKEIMMDGHQFVKSI